MRGIFQRGFSNPNLMRTGANLESFPNAQQILANYKREGTVPISSPLELSKYEEQKSPIVENQKDSWKSPVNFSLNFNSQLLPINNFSKESSTESAKRSKKARVRECPSDNLKIENKECVIKHSNKKLALIVTVTVFFSVLVTGLITGLISKHSVKECRENVFRKKSKS